MFLRFGDAVGHTGLLGTFAIRDAHRRHHQDVARSVAYVRPDAPKRGPRVWRPHGVRGTVPA